MKITLIFYFFCFTNSLCAMQNDIITHTMIFAIENGKIKEFPQLIDHIRAQNLINQKKCLENAPINDLHFYRELGSGLISLSGAAALIGLFVFANLENPHVDFIKNEVRLGEAASTLISRGVQQLYLAWKAEDHEYAKQLAIKLLLHKVGTRGK